MNESKKQKKYYLQLKLKKKNKVEFITLINDSLPEIDKITSISYTKERFLAIFHPSFIKYILNNYDSGDLVVTYKSGEYIKEIPTIQREERFMAYITCDEIEDIIFDKIINSKRINGRKITQGDYFVSLMNINYYYAKLRGEELLRVHRGQLGKRVAIEALLSMKLINKPNEYVPTPEDVELIQKKLLEIYFTTRNYFNFRAQITLENFVVDKGIIRERSNAILMNDILPYLREITDNPAAEYIIDESFRPENLALMIPTQPVIENFAEFSRYEDEQAAYRQKMIRHNNFQRPVKNIYQEKILEYQSCFEQEPEAINRLILEIK